MQQPFTLIQACSHGWGTPQKLLYLLDQLFSVQVFLQQYLGDIIQINDPKLSCSINGRVLAAVQSLNSKHLGGGCTQRVPPLIQQVSSQLHPQRSIAAAQPMLKQLYVSLTRTYIISIHRELQQGSQLAQVILGD